MRKIILLALICLVVPLRAHGELIGEVSGEVVAIRGSQEVLNPWWKESTATARANGTLEYDVLSEDNVLYEVIVREDSKQPRVNLVYTVCRGTSITFLPDSILFTKRKEDGARITSASSASIVIDDDEDADCDY